MELIYKPSPKQMAQRMNTRSLMFIVVYIRIAGTLIPFVIEGSNSLLAQGKSCWHVNMCGGLMDNNAAVKTVHAKEKESNVVMIEK